MHSPHQLHQPAHSQLGPQHADHTPAELKTALALHCTLNNILCTHYTVYTTIYAPSSWNDVSFTTPRAYNPTLHTIILKIHTYCTIKCAPCIGGKILFKSIYIIAVLASVMTHKLALNERDAFNISSYRSGNATQCSNECVTWWSLLAVRCNARQSGGV